MSGSDRIEIRLLTEADIPAAMRLKELANWNQTTADWRRLCLLEPEGCFAAVAEGQVVGTTTTTTYGKTLAWIGMVLVDPSFRRLGIATRLLNKAIEYASSRVATLKLDATSDGQPVYERLGFRVESRIERWVGEVEGHRSVSHESENPSVSKGADMLELDRGAFGADRSQLLEKLIEDANGESVVLRSLEGKIDAYALARSGSRGSYFGPAIVSASGDAAALLDAMLPRLKQQRVYVDWNTASIANSLVLLERGFTKERELVRMSYGKQSAPTAETVFAIAGPEVG
jgi:GNAT superfamily N-acetyltransferase